MAGAAPAPASTGDPGAAAGYAAVQAILAESRERCWTHAVEGCCGSTSWRRGGPEARAAGGGGIVAGSSPLYQRIILGADDPDVMPAEGGTDPGQGSPA